MNLKLELFGAWCAGQLPREEIRSLDLTWNERKSCLKINVLFKKGANLEVILSNLTRALYDSFPEEQLDSTGKILGKWAFLDIELQELFVSLSLMTAF